MSWWSPGEKDKSLKFFGRLRSSLLSSEYFFKSGTLKRDSHRILSILFHYSSSNNNNNNKINKITQTRCCAEKAEVKFPFFSMWIPPHLSRVGTLTVQLEANITMCIFYSSFGRAGERRNILGARGQGKLLFLKLLFRPHGEGPACAALAVCNCSGPCFGWESQPSSADAMELQWLEAPLELCSSSPEPRYAVPSVVSPPKAAKSQMKAQVLCSDCEGCNKGLF